MTTIELNDEELEVDDGDTPMARLFGCCSDDDTICPQCNGSGEGMYDGSICHACHGSGVERDDSGKEDYEADRADQINDERKLAGEWE